MQNKNMEIALNKKYNQIIRRPKKYLPQSQWIAPPKTKGIKYISFLGSTGYADAARNYVRSLLEYGIFVYFESVRCFGGKPSHLLSVDDLALAICMENKHIEYDTVIIHTIPHYFHQCVDKERKLNPSVKIYGLTVWETDSVYPKWLNIIDNVKFDGLIVPSQWNKKIFEDSAKNHSLTNFPPIYSCHHVISSTHNINKKTLNKKTLYGRFRLAFLCIGTWTPRKGIAETIEAYLNAFQGQKDVTLYVKTNSGNYSKKHGLILRYRLKKILSNYENPPQIILDTELRSDDYIDALIENCDVYLSLCNSEGVGLSACSAALKEKIVIMTGYGGQTEYIQNAFWIEYKLDVVQVPTNFAEWIRPPQKWAYPDLNHAIQCLQSVHQNYQQLLKQQLFKQNRNFILKTFSYTSIAQKLASIIGWT